MKHKYSRCKKSALAGAGGSFLALLLACGMMLCLTACKEERKTAGAGKEVWYELRNTSGAPVVLTVGSGPNAWDDVDAVDVESHLREPGVVFSVREEVGMFAQDGGFVETSPSSYQMTMYFAAGTVPEGEPNLYMGSEWKQICPDAMGAVYRVTISGTYNQLAVIEWTGSSISQTR